MEVYPDERPPTFFFFFPSFSFFFFFFSFCLSFYWHFTFFFFFSCFLESFLNTFPCKCLNPYPPRIRPLSISPLLSLNGGQCLKKKVSVCMGVCVHCIAVNITRLLVPDNHRLHGGVLSKLRSFGGLIAIGSSLEAHNSGAV